MNTFLPHPDYDQSAKCLDRQRLGKQRSEVKAILSMIKSGSRHPAAQMWVGHEWWLLEYGIAVCYEWTERGYVDNLFSEFLALQGSYSKGPRPVFPEAWHSSCRANLLRKDSAYYGKFGWAELPQEGYAWPRFNSSS